MTYNVIFCVFVVLGCTVQLDSVLDFSDSMVFAMALANIIGIVALAPTVKREIKGYWDRMDERGLS